MSLASAKEYVGVNLLDFYSKTKQGWWETKIRGKKQNNGGKNDVVHINWLGGIEK